MRSPVLFICLGVAACGGGDGATVAGTFAPGSGLVPTGVWVVEAERSEPADSSGFEVSGLTPGPVTLRLMQGADTAAILDVENLPTGATLRLLGLRADPDTRLAFPQSVELGGADIVRVNGVRLAPEGRVPREVDVPATVLGYAPDAGALLVRPGDADLPDLRVVIGMATEIVGASGPVDAASLQPGDSVRVEGRSERGYVVASRISLPLSTALLDTPLESTGSSASTDDDDRGGEPAGGGGGDDGGDGGTAASPAPAPVVRSDPPGRGRGNGNGRGEEKGRGRGKKPKN